MLNSLQIISIFSERGMAAPISHLETICLVTFNFSANSSCERPFFFLISNILLPNFNLSGTLFASIFFIPLL